MVYFENNTALPLLDIYIYSFRRRFYPKLQSVTYWNATVMHQPQHWGECLNLPKLYTIALLPISEEWKTALSLQYHVCECIFVVDVYC